MVTVDKEGELHKPNSFIKHETFVVVQIVNIVELDGTYHFPQYIYIWGGGEASVDRDAE